MTDKIFNFLINYFSNINDRGVDEMNNFKGDITSDEIVEWLKKIQNINSEQPSEELKYLAISLEESIGTSPHSRETIISYLQQAVQWQKEQLINKACTWILNNFRYSGYGCPLYYNGVNYAPNYIVKDFKKAMEE